MPGATVPGGLTTTHPFEPEKGHGQLDLPSHSIKCPSSASCASPQKHPHRTSCLRARTASTCQPQNRQIVGPTCSCGCCLPGGAGATRALGATETIASRMAFLYGPQEMGHTFHQLEDWGSEVSGEEIPVDGNCSTHQENQETSEAKVMNR